MADLIDDLLAGNDRKRKRKVDVSLSLDNELARELDEQRKGEPFENRSEFAQHLLGNALLEHKKRRNHR